jgi:hypothetical protein
MTPGEIQNKFNALLRWTGPPGGGGGPGGPEGPGGPGRLGGPGVPPAQVLQQPIVPAADIKTMGQLPQIFIGDCTKADDFIEEVKGYLHLNQDMAGFNSPQKKIAFMLTLIKGPNTAGWTQDMGELLDGLGPMDNIPELLQFDFDC